ncbi:MAG: methyltransferase type 11 [Prochloron sp. SP5CPC1]|nr:methyltransferase type 11 [Candidatus Paraprochloron terpiosi SP5CPC1]
MSNSLYVQYGCGFCAPESWLNFDSALTVWIERLPLIGRFYSSPKAIGESQQVKRCRFPEHIRYGDIVRGLPVSENSCSGVYACHILEHLCLEEFRLALLNTFNILKPGGIFRLIVPDLEIAAKNYLSSDSPTASIEFLKSTMIGTKKRSIGLKSFLKNALGSNSVAHLWMWDYKALSQELLTVGFSDIRPAHFNDSEDKRFSEVEEKYRFVDAVAIQAKKSV